MRHALVALLTPFSLFGLTSTAQVSPTLPSPFSSGFCFETFSSHLNDVYYINGIKTSQEAGAAGLEKIIGFVEETYGPYIEECGEETDRPAPFEYYLQYNSSAGGVIPGLADAFEVAGQLRNTEKVRALIATFAALDGGFERGTNFAGIETPVDLTDDQAAEVTSVLTNGGDLEDVRSFASDYDTSLDIIEADRPRCPLIVGYSQGSVLANRAYIRLATQRNVGCTNIVAIGMPDSFVEGQGAVTSP